jgi:hypothetical protein
MAFWKVVDSVKDFVVIAGQMLQAADSKIAYVVPPSVFKFASQYSLAREAAKKLVQSGGHVLGITSLSFYYIDTVRELLDIGEAYTMSIT